MQASPAASTPRCGWDDHCHIAKSERAHAGLGLFAARHFPGGAAIGCHAGRDRWTSEHPGGGQPSQEFVDQTGASQHYSLTCRRGDGRLTVLDPVPVHSFDSKLEKQKTAPLFMGMHCINDAVENLSGGARNENKQSQNAQIVSDGTALATKRIGPGEEILSCCNRGDDDSIGQSDLEQCKEESDDEHDESEIGDKDAPSDLDEKATAKKPAAKEKPQQKRKKQETKKPAAEKKRKLKRKNQNKGRKPKKLGK